jgi:hypothetical protein
MNLNKILIKDSSGKPSATMTAFVTGFLVVNAKLLLSGITLAGYTMAAFTGGEYAAALSALGGIYVMRRNFGNENKDGKE